jgi:hypothetical protein
VLSNDAILRFATICKCCGTLINPAVDLHRHRTLVEREDTEVEKLTCKPSTMMIVERLVKPTASVARSPTISISCH